MLAAYKCTDLDLYTTFSIDDLLHVTFENVPTTLRIHVELFRPWSEVFAVVFQGAG